MVSSILRIMSQVEYTKKRNSIDSESNSVKQNAVLHVTLVLPYGKKRFLAWTECSDTKRWLIKYKWLFQSIGGLQQLFCWCFTKNVAKNTSPIAGRVSKVKCYMYHSNHVFYVMATIIPLFSYSSALYRREVMPRCSNNLSYIFIHTYFHCQASKANK